VFVLYPDPYSLPTYRIGPFQTRDISLNQVLPDLDRIDDYFHERFTDRRFTYTHNGREAIYLALNHYKLSKNDVITIMTSSGNFYISSCVTNEIEKFCKWSREILPETKVLFVNHEFGYPYPEMQKLKLLNLPIIEDCAGSFFSEDHESTIGGTGEFVIYSFPKMFPLQVGGLLVSGSGIHHSFEAKLQTKMLQHIKNVLSE
jgi:dTDP-4-amino-4,6-dideoxygalactose transaminase